LALALPRRAVEETEQSSTIESIKHPVAFNGSSIMLTEAGETGSVVSVEGVACFSRRL
jgi:hypothetical protein